jgi:hypothetical protein
MDKILLTEAEHDAVADEYFNQPVPQKYSRRELTSRAQARKIMAEFDRIKKTPKQSEGWRIGERNKLLERLRGELDAFLNTG